MLPQGALCLIVFRSFPQGNWLSFKHKVLMNMLTCDYFSVFGWFICIWYLHNRCLMDYQVLLHFERSETRVSVYFPILRNTLAILDCRSQPMNEVARELMKNDTIQKISLTHSNPSVSQPLCICTGQLQFQGRRAASGNLGLQ